MEYDIIGDIHGHATRLKALLKVLGYSDVSGAYRHCEPNRKVIFLGDIMDRGPEQVEALCIVRRMCEAGAAHCIMGNHEHAAVGWTLEDPMKKGEFMRPHNANNTKTHSEFLRQIGDGSDIHKELVGWMSSLPLYLELAGVRCVHACWDKKSQDYLLGLGLENEVMSRDIFMSSLRKNDLVRDAVDTLIRGYEVQLPKGVSFHDSNGILRHKSRAKWWMKEKAIYMSDIVIDNLNCGGVRVPEEDIRPDTTVDTRPIFFGHYWMTGEPKILSNKTACLDFSVAKGGVLTAYRWRGEDVLDNKNLVWV